MTRSLWAGEKAAPSVDVAVTAAPTFKVGDRVNHESRGGGVVRSADAESGTLTVAFDTGEMHHLDSASLSPGKLRALLPSSSAAASRPCCACPLGAVRLALLPSWRTLLPQSHAIPLLCSTRNTACPRSFMVRQGFFWLVGL